MKGRDHRRRGFLALTLLALALAGCGGDDEGSPSEADSNGSGSSAASEVVMRLIAFRPEALSVPAGSTVTWTQTDAGSHTVTSGTVTQGGAGVTTAPDGRFDSGNIATDATFKFTFAEVGTFPYFCAVHPATMRGEVRVT